MLTNEAIRRKSEAILKKAYGKDASFREGQYEAIEATLKNKRTLVVQKTGWGKSLVYFIAAKLLRKENRGFTIIISPLLELMENQIEAAQKLDLECDRLNSTIKNKEERTAILDNVVGGRIDILFTTPETLFKQEVQDRLSEMNVGLFVIDEAHCLSDWGHDFRRDYGRLYKVIDVLPETTPVLCVTATANDRVIEDLKHHLGENVYISRGDLMRNSLYLQTLKLHNKAERYAWIADHINELPGSGIIYCLTRRECQRLADFLNSTGIPAESYFSRSTQNDEELNAVAIEKFRRNEIKVIVATIKLGMGYDKPDIGFVIHYQRPQNVVAYYQQIGRAGRAISRAYAILMTGPEDDDIHNYFIETAFPKEELCNKVLGAASGKSKLQIESLINDRKSRIENAIYFLEFDGFLRKDGNKYYRSPKPFKYDKEHYNAISNMRKQEAKQMRDLTSTDQCLLEFTVQCLNNPVLKKCGHCANCVGRPLIEETYSSESLIAAQEFIKNSLLVIKPRLQWATTNLTGATRIEYPLQEGICLSIYGDVGYGEMVANDKYHAENYRDELLDRSIQVLEAIVKKESIEALTCVPSRRNSKVNVFAKKLARGLGLDYFEAIEKAEAPQQKTMENSSYQCENALKSYSIRSNISISYNTILVDDIVDSKWTLTVCGNLLGEHGCPVVVPFCLANSSEVK